MCLPREAHGSVRSGGDPQVHVSDPSVVYFPAVAVLSMNDRVPLINETSGLLS